MKNILTVMVLISCLCANAKKPIGVLKGKVLETNSAEPIAYVNVKITNGATQEFYTNTNWEGEYIFHNLDTGSYKVTFSYVGYQTKEINKVRIMEDKIMVLNATLSQGVALQSVVIVEHKDTDQNKKSIPNANVLSNNIEISEVVVQGYTKPLIERDQTSTSTTTTREEIEKMAVRSVTDVAVTSGNGVYSRDNSVYVRGNRVGNSVVYIDGVKVIGSTSLPAMAIEEVSVHTSGVSAMYENNQNEIESEVIIRTRFNNSTSSTRQTPRKKTKEELFLEQAEEVVVYENELYQEIVDNPFESPKNSPLSTFSIDVDKASYANTRRFVNQGVLPPVNAVRIEELINYFNYDYPQPSTEHPFSITTELTVCPWNAERKLALIGIQGEKVEMEAAPASNLVFLLDVSGSMSSPNKLDLLKKGLSLLINQLRDEDRLAIVVYAGAAGVVLKSTTGGHKNQIKQVLNRLQAGGSTAGGAGIQLAYKIAQQNFIKEGNNRIILATDGDFNVGTSSQEALVSLIEEKRQSGIFLSVLGLGTGNLQDYKMEQLANKGNGNYNYIDNILEAKKVLVEEMGGTLYTIAKDVKVQAEFNPSLVKAYRLIGYVNRALNDEDFNNDRKDAGELGSGHTVTVLYEIIPAGSTEKIMDIDDLKYQAEKKEINNYKNELLTVKFRYKKPNGTTSILLTETMKDHTKSLQDCSNNLQFASAVAAFGMKLRKSESTQAMSYQSIIAQAQRSKGVDLKGYRAEFIKLLERVELME